MRRERVKRKLRRKEGEDLNSFCCEERGRSEKQVRREKERGKVLSIKENIAEKGKTEKARVDFIQ